MLSPIHLTPSKITVILRITELEQTMTDRVYWEKKATKLYHACADCGSEVDKRRAKLGYDVCMMCGDAHAKEARLGWTIAPMHKSNYVLITNLEELKGINVKN
jgi:ribosomal protein L37AE/L43A